MNTPQKGIFVEGHRYLHVLEYTLSPDATAESIAVAIEAAQASNVAVVIAFGAQLWAKLARDRMPRGFSDFHPIQGPKHSAPATQRDVLVWLHGSARDFVLDAVLAVDGVLSKIGTRQADVSGFVYHDSRDLTGFVDGSANPKDGPSKREAALIPSGEPGEGGAFVFSQIWEHNLESFNALKVPDQERVFGRTKADSIELEGDAQPSDSHVSRTDLKIDGIAQKMYRRSFPYGGAGTHGLYFLAFSCDQARFENVLHSMYGLSKDGVSDRLLSFTTPKSGSFWFAPSTEDLKAALT